VETRYIGQLVKRLALEAGFELAGITPAVPSSDAGAFFEWIGAGMAGEMRYLTDHRAEIRNEPRKLLPSAKSILCVGQWYGGNDSLTSETCSPDQGWIARYARGPDYHVVMREKLEALVVRLKQELGSFDHKICVDTAPLLERSYARTAGLGWIGKNTCLINQEQGSWFLLGEVLLSLELENDHAPPDRCGSCTRCIDACPTTAIVPGRNGWQLDSRKCISYFTIELRDSVPDEHRKSIGPHVFGCDICQDVCPWNNRRNKGPGTMGGCVASKEHDHSDASPPLSELANLSRDEFRARFRGTALERVKYSGFLRNVAVAMGNSGLQKFREPLEQLARSEDAVVAGHARWALERIRANILAVEQ
jgi:epoxyqueuosine reductase